jgi:D-sedoheptulose 7-phosphate isomerase/D-glycero-D-manno-heptose 1,7-bisphosphate phosphatase
MRRPGVLLDRDGTIIADSGHVGSVDRVEFLEGSIEAIAALNRAGVPVAVVTNQAGVARGYYGIEDVEQVHKHMIAELARHGAHADLWLFCPYHPDGVVPAFTRASADRKPGPGMALAAAQALGLDLQSSWVIGDAPADAGLARAVGAHPVHVGPVASPEPDVVSFPGLAAAVQHILASGAVAVPHERPAFPARRFTDAAGFGGAYAAELSRAFGSVDLRQVRAAAAILQQAYDRDAAVYACGNGGSASIANHLQCDHVKGIRNGTGLTTRVFSLSTNIELFSAVANDHGYDTVFEYQLQSVARPGDVLIAVSSSGRSANIVRALEWARSHELTTIALTGFSGGAARELATVAIHVASDNYGIVEDAHQACVHLLAQYVRQYRMTEDAVTAAIF